MSQEVKPAAKLTRERVVILTDQELIEGTICYVEGVRLSDALNSETAHLSRPHLPLVDATVSHRITGEVILRSRFLLVARSRIVVLLPKSEFCPGDAPPAGESEEGDSARKNTYGAVSPSRPTSDIPTLIATLKDPDECARRTAAERLAQLGSRAKTAIPTLLERLKDPDELVRGQCAEALGNIGQHSPELVAALRRLLKDANEFVRRMAAGALGNFGTAAAGTVADLREALNDDEEFVRRAAAAALGKIGASASPAIPALQAAMQDSDVIVRHLASVALNKIVGAEARDCQNRNR
jgi:vesicle coat complex subunit